jgi:saccharopine dehydrogenase (NADP+, L-glutamate forming)
VKLRLTVFGAGRVAGPALEYLLRSHQVILIDSDVNALAAHRARLAGGELITRKSDIGSPGAFDDIRGSACVVSLLPPAMHVAVARECIRERVPLVTTSYVSESMRALHGEAVSCGVALLNECGLDPGVDHMLAMRSIDAVHRENGTVRSLVSQCGGIPADAAVNPLGYKVSWSPAGVIAAARQGARYVDDGVIRELSSAEVFASATRIDVPGVGHLEAFYNRDSVPYADAYGVIDQVKRFARMTLRYPGWCETFAALSQIGALSDDTLPSGAIALDILGISPAEASPRTAAADRLNLDPRSSAVLDRFEWLGLFSHDRIGQGVRTRVEALVARMTSLLHYDMQEMDRVVLRHELEADYRDGSTKSETTLLVVDGTPGGSSAMARCVGVPAAVAATLLAEGHVVAPGVQIPSAPSLYEPILTTLASEQLAPTVTTLQRPKRL